MADQHIRRPSRAASAGKIERHHRTMTNVVKLGNFYHPDQLKEAINQFVDRYNNQRYHESLSNLTPADVYFGRGELILKRREQIKNQTLKQRKIQYLLSKHLSKFVLKHTHKRFINSDIHRLLSGHPRDK